jgi:hypothetical protein
MSIVFAIFFYPGISVLLLSIGYLSDEEPMPQEWRNSDGDMSLPSRQDAFPAKGFEHKAEHQSIEGCEASEA